MKRIIVLILILTILLGGFFCWQIYISKNKSNQENKSFLIESGQSFLQIGKNLEKEGLIKSRIYFDSYVILTGKYKKLQAGEYALNPSMTIFEITKKITKGDINRKKITIVEGWNLIDIAQYLEKENLFQAQDFFEIAGFPLIGDYSEIKDALPPKDFSGDFVFLKEKPQNLGLEGYLFPDTYEINKGENLEQIIRKILSNFDKKLTVELRNEINRQGKTVFQIVTAASLIEKEVRIFEDKEIVAGILWKRLENGIPLQVDATISYITGRKSIEISIEETKIDSPYNTYKYRGLPLGPISNPGIESIKAAIYSKESDYLYYLSTPEGKTIFSKTLKEHNEAKARYLK